MAYFPRKHPILSFPSGVVLSTIGCFFIISKVLSNSSSYLVPFTISFARGCSGAMTRYVTLYIVSHLVVKAGNTLSSSLKYISVPSLLPIQFLCIVFTLSGHSLRSSIPLSNSSAYFVILKYHCSSSVCVTSLLHLQHLPSMTCSLARTVEQSGHQLTKDFFL